MLLGVLQFSRPPAVDSLSLTEAYHQLVGPKGLVTPKPDISNNVGPVKLFLNTLLSFHLKEFFSFVLFVSFLLCIDDHGSFVI